jgi:hypothetical protein
MVISLPQDNLHELLDDDEGGRKTDGDAPRRGPDLSRPGDPLSSEAPTRVRGFTHKGFNQGEPSAGPEIPPIV